MYYKLHPGIQRLVIKESNDSSLDFAGFVTACTQTANRLEMITSQEQRLKNRSQNTTTRSSLEEPLTAKARSSNTTAPRHSPPKAGGLSDEERIRLVKEGKCFYCKESGHLSRECPVKKRTAELKALTLLNRPQDEGETSGKENP